MKALLATLLLLLWAPPAQALPLLPDLLILNYCDMTPTTIYGCLDRGYPFYLDVQVQPTPGVYEYVLSPAQATSLGIPLLTSVDYFGLLTNYWYTLFPPWWDSHALAFIAKTPPVVWAAPTSGEVVMLVANPEPATLALWGLTLTGLGWWWKRRA